MATRKKKAEGEESAPKKSQAPAPDLSLITGRVISERAEKATEKKRLDFDEYGYYRKTKKKPCEWAQKDKEFPAGRTELEIVSDRDAKSLGVPAGPALRLCINKNEKAPIIHVRDPEEAREIGTLFRNCVMSGGKDKMACAADVLGKKRPGEPVHLAGRSGKKSPAKKRGRKASR